MPRQATVEEIMSTLLRRSSGTGGGGLFDVGQYRNYRAGLPRGSRFQSALPGDQEFDRDFNTTGLRPIANVDASVERNKQQAQKLLDENPNMPDSLRSKLERILRGEVKHKQGGGWLGGAFNILKILDRPRRLVGALIADIALDHSSNSNVEGEIKAGDYWDILRGRSDRVAERVGPEVAGEHGDFSFSHLLTRMGWEKSGNWWGNVGRWLTATIGDVATDPLTYIMSGFSAFGKTAAGTDAMAVGARAAGEAFEGIVEDGIIRKAAVEFDEPLHRLLREAKETHLDRLAREQVEASRKAVGDMIPGKVPTIRLEDARRMPSIQKEAELLAQRDVINPVLTPLSTRDFAKLPAYWLDYSGTPAYLKGGVRIATPFNPRGGLAVPGTRGLKRKLLGKVPGLSGTPLHDVLAKSPTFNRFWKGMRRRFGADIPAQEFAAAGKGFEAYMVQREPILMLRALDLDETVPALQKSITDLATVAKEQGLSSGERFTVMRSVLTWIQEGAGRRENPALNVTGQVVGRTVEQVDEAMHVVAQNARQVLKVIRDLAVKVDPNFGEIVDYAPQMLSREGGKALRLVSDGVLDVPLDSEAGGWLRQLAAARDSARRTGGTAGTAPHFMSRDFGATAMLDSLVMQGDTLLIRPKWLEATGFNLTQLNAELQSELERAYARAGLKLPKPRKGEIFQLFDTRPDVVLNTYVDSMKAAIHQRAAVKEMRKWNLAVPTEAKVQIQHTLNALAQVHSEVLHSRLRQMVRYAQEQIDDVQARPWKIKMVRLGKAKVGLPEPVVDHPLVRQALDKARKALAAAERKGMASEKAWRLRVEKAKARFGVSEKTAELYAAVEIPQSLDELTEAAVLAARDAAFEFRRGVDLIGTLEDITPQVRARLQEIADNMDLEVVAAKSNMVFLREEWRKAGQWVGSGKARELIGQDVTDVAELLQRRMDELANLRRSAAEAAAKDNHIAAERLDAAAKALPDASDPYAYAARQRAVIREDGEGLFQLQGLLDDVPEGVFTVEELADLRSSISVFDDIWDSPNLRDKWAEWWGTLGGNRTVQSGRKRWRKFVASARRRVDQAERAVEVRPADTDVLASLFRGRLDEAAPYVDGLNRIATDAGLPGRLSILNIDGEWRMFHEWDVEAPRKISLAEAADRLNRGEDIAGLGLSGHQEEILSKFRRFRERITGAETHLVGELGRELSQKQLLGYGAWMKVEKVLTRVADGTASPDELRRLLRYVKDGHVVQTDVYKALKGVLDGDHLAELNRLAEELMAVKAIRADARMRRQMTEAAVAADRAAEGEAALERVGGEVADALRTAEVQVYADDILTVGIFVRKLRDIQAKWGPNTQAFDRADVSQLAVGKAEKFIEDLDELRMWGRDVTGSTVGRAVLSKSEREAVEEALRAKRVSVSPGVGFVRPETVGAQAAYLDGLALQKLAAVMLENASNTYKAMYLPEFIATMKDHSNAAIRYWKGAATVQRPGFHIRNMMGGIFNNIIGGVTPKYYFMVGPHIGKFRKVWEETGSLAKALATIKSKRIRRIFEAAAREDVFSKSFSVSEFRGLIHGRRARMKTLNLADPDHFLNRAGGKTMERIEDTLRLALFAKWFDPALKGSDQVAAQIVLALHFDYTNLTRLERSIKSLVPFFVWTRRNVPLQMRMLVERPGIANAYVRMMEEGKQQFGSTPMDGMPMSPWWTAEAVGTDVIFNKDSPWWARVVLDPDLPITDLTELPLSLSPSDWANYVSSHVSPLINVPIDMITEADYPDANSPLGLGLVTRLLAEAGLWGQVTTGGDVQMSRGWLTAWNTLFPQANDIAPLLAPFAPGLLDPSSPNARQNLALTESPDEGERLRAALLSLGKGVGIKLQTPATIAGPAFDDSEMIRQVRNALQRSGDIPPP